MNAEKAVEYANKGCMWFYMLILIPMVCGSALGYGASAGIFPELKAFIDSGNAAKLAQLSATILGFLIGLGIGLWLAQQIVRILFNDH